jgi:hypothetical protein
MSRTTVVSCRCVEDVVNSLSRPPQKKVFPFLLATFPLSAERSRSGERNKQERPKEPAGVGKTKEYAARKFQKTNKEVKEKKEMIIKKI